MTARTAIRNVPPALRALLPASTRERLGSPESVLLVGHIVARGLGFLFPFVVAHALDKDGFAFVYFFITTGWFASELILTSYPVACTWALAGDTSRGRGSWLVASLVGGAPLLLMSIVAGAVLAFIGGHGATLMTVVVVGLAVDAYYFAALRGLAEFRLLMVYRVAANLFQILILLALVVVGWASPAAMVVTYSFVYVVPIVLIEAGRAPLVRILRRVPRPTRAQVRRLTGVAIPTLVRGTAWAAVIGLDVFFVEIFAPDALASYAADRTLVVPMTLVPWALTVLILPRSVSASATARWRLLARALKVSTVVSVALCALYIVAGPLALRLLFPAEYSDAGEAILILAPALGLMATYEIMSEWWIGIGRPVTPALAIVAGAVVTVGAHLVLTAAHGALGAATSVAIGAGTALGLLAAATARLRMQERRADALTAGGQEDAA